MLMKIQHENTQPGTIGPLAPLREAVDHVRGCAMRQLGGAREQLRRAVTQEAAAAPLAGEGFTLSARSDVPVNRLAVRRGNYAALIPGESVAEAVITSGISSTLSLFQSALIVRLILTWFPTPPQALISPLATICDPYLNLFRGIIPPINGTIDLSPILAFVALDLFTGSAAALPAEMPPCEDPSGSYPTFKASK